MTVFLWTMAALGILRALPFVIRKLSRTRVHYQRWRIRTEERRFQRTFDVPDHPRNIRRWE